MSHTEQLDAKLADLMQLPPADRAYLAERLIESIPGIIDEASMAEYRRRLQELDDGTVEGILAEDVTAEMQRMLDEEYPLPS